MPLDPPCTRSDSPSERRARSKTLVHTVKNVSGSAAASAASSPAGIGRQSGAAAVQYSAYPPPVTSAHTRDPIAGVSTPSPSLTTVPATSSPGMSDAPGGGG